MKKAYFITLFLSTNLFFIFFLVYKKSVMIELSFQKQTYEKQKVALIKQKENIQAKLCSLQNRVALQDYAQHELHMQKLDRKQVKILPMKSL